MKPDYPGLARLIRRAMEQGKPQETEWLVELTAVAVKIFTAMDDEFDPEAFMREAFQGDRPAN